jgi:hypothetical protein
MYFQYPLEALARKREAASQLEFAREARRALRDSDEAVFEPFDRGLAIFAVNEEALQEPTRILHDLYGDQVEVRRPKVRYLPGDPLHEPIMHVRVTARREWAGRVLAELRMRGATILEESMRQRVYVLRAEAPLSLLLGLQATLDAITGVDTPCVMRLVRYEPLPPPGGEAA